MALQMSNLRHLAVFLVFLPSLAVAVSATEVKPIRFSFSNAELTQVIDAYSKASGQKFVIDPSVRGKATILSKKELPVDEAFSLLSIALATNGFAISERGDTMVVLSARSAQRSLIPTVTELPPLKPERMITMIFSLKHVSASVLNKELRILTSKDGEMSPFEPGNKVIFSDWVSNLHRIARIITELDVPSANAAK